MLAQTTGNLFLTAKGNQRIQIFNEDVVCSLTIHGKGSESHCFQDLWRLALDPHENIHVAVDGSNAINMFTKEGVYVRKYSELNCSFGIAIDGKVTVLSVSSVYIAIRGACTVMKYN